MQKTISILVAIMLISVSSLQAQKMANNTTTGFVKGTNVVDAGIGFSSYGIPIHGSFEHFVTDEISAGAALNYASYSESYGSTKGTWTFLYGGVKGNYHFQKLFKIKEDNIDLYAGATLGYWHGTYSVQNVSVSGLGNTTYLLFQVGGRYFFSERIGAFCEIGGGNLSGMTAGVSFKF